MNKEKVLELIKELNLDGKSLKTICTEMRRECKLDSNDTCKVIDDLSANGLIYKDERGKVFLTNTKDYMIGVLNGNSKGFCFCVDSNDKDRDDIFVANPNLNGAMHGDTVLLGVRKNNRDGRLEGVVLKILKRGIKTLVGTIQVYDKFSFVVPDNKKIFKDVYIKKGNELNAKNGQKVFVLISSYEGKSMTGSVIEILGEKTGDVTTDVLCIIRSYELIEEFSDRLLQSAKSIPQSVDASKYKERLDLRNDIIFTIDGDDTKDYDDAVSLRMDGEDYILGVHIADVGEYVKRDSLLDEEAFERGTSAYFPNCVLPMLPRELSNGICSLNPKVDRLTLSCICRIDRRGKILDHKITESIINSCERMTYHNVTAILEGDKELNERYERIVPTLKLMEELNTILEKVRNERGEINFEIPEAKIILDENLEVKSLTQRPRTVSERMIESFMLVANEVVAEHFCKLKVPFVYRIHEVPDGEKISQFNDYASALSLKLTASGNKLSPKDVQDFMNKIPDDDMKEIVNSVLLRAMQKAKYSSDCLGHFGLAASYYCHFTSPIRRYPDLTIHRIIKQYLHNEIKGNVEKELKSFVVKASAQSSERELLAQRAERDVDDYFKCRYMRDKIGEVFDVTIDSITNFGFFVQLPNTVEGLVSITSLKGTGFEFNEKSVTLSNGIVTYRLGDKIKVKLLNVNMNERNIDFEVAE